ncbi:MAG: PadR family transcriptional regulator [Actinobacteria bacterium]|nr:PadR family transcriptional regulator [Actinomycetota bacterium]
MGFLAEKGSTGYDLKTREFSKASPLWPADQAQIYRTLEKLRTKRLVSVRKIRQSDRPDRREYALTPAGRKALSSWLATPSAPATVRDPLMLQLNFGEYVPEEDLYAVLAARRELMQSQLETLRSRLSAHEGMGQGHSTRAHALRRMVLLGRLSQIRASIDWLDDCIDSLDVAEGQALQSDLFDAT